MTPQQMGLLGMAGAMLTPGQGLGQGFQAFGQGLAQGQQVQAMQQRTALLNRQMQLAEEERQQEMQKAAAATQLRGQISSLMGIHAAERTQDQRQQLTGLLLQSGMKAPEVTAFFGSENLGRPKVARTIEGVGPDGRPMTTQYDDYGNAVGGSVAKPFELRSTNLDGVQVNQNPYTGEQVGPALQRTPFGYNPDGSMRPGYLAGKAAVASAGAPRTMVNLAENDFLKGVGSGAAKSLVDSADAARGAVSSIETARNLASALNAGSINAGPGATVQQFFDQVANKMGVAGKDQNERMIRTREAIQSLAQLELNAAQQMKGQGQITEAERAILRRAASGDIQSMTADELRTLGGVTDRTARMRIRQHNARLKPLESNPNAAMILPSLSVEEPQEVTFSKGTSAVPSIDDLLRKYGR